jgi:phosphatidylserine/phosphatidylglycerophosphate/cardiolipin synthase-like enzyme
MRKFTQSLFLILFLATTSSVFGQITIAEARSLGVNANVTFRGVITNGSELGLIRYIQDATGGLGIYSSNFAGQLNRGDSVEISGTIVDFNGLLELNPVTASNPFGLTTLPNPQVVSPIQLNEDLESELVRLNGVVFSDGGTAFAGNTSYTFTQGAEQSTIYVRNSSPLVGQIIPVGNIDLVGICSQYNAIYQVLPRDTNDFIVSPGINIISTITINNFQTNGATLSWETDLAGTTEVAYGFTPQLEFGTLSDNNPVTAHSFTLNTLLPGQIYYAQVSSSLNGDTSTSAIQVFGTQSLSAGWIKSYFNHDVDTSYGSSLPELTQINALDDTLIAYINRAELTLDLTIYDFDNASISSISAAINAAYNRGVRVRFISDGSRDSSNYGTLDLIPEIQQLLSPVGGNYSIMHNKFVVIDADHDDPNKAIVWTGSTNWTDRQINRDPNNVIIVQDQTLARTYKLEFEEMWGSSFDNPDTTVSRFGFEKQDNTPHEFVIGGKRVECYFSPSDNTNQELIKTLLTANDSVQFASMLITRFDIANAIDTLIANGVSVAGLINNSSTTTVFSQLLTSMGNQLFVNADTNIIMHHKFFVVDAGSDNDPIVWTGSHNWSTNANTRNDENTLVIHDAEVADWYHRAYFRLTHPVIPDSTVGVLKVDNSNAVQVFPTLVNQPSAIQLVSSISESASIQLTDMQGKILFNEKLNLKNGQVLSLSMLPNVADGLYLLSIRTSNTIFSSKFQVAN